MALELLLLPRMSRRFLHTDSRLGIIILSSNPDEWLGGGQDPVARGRDGAPTGTGRENWR